MKILFTSNLSDMGGGETSILQLMLELKKNHEIYLLCCKEGPFPKAARENNITVYIDDFKRKNIVLSFLNFMKLGKFDVIHHNECSAALLYGFFLKISKNSKLNCWTCHGQWYTFNKVKRMLVRKLIDMIFCVSQNVQNNLHKQLITNTELTYLGVDFKQSIVQTSSIRNEIGVTKNEKLIAVVARYEKIKGQLKAIIALNDLIVKDSSIHLILAGGILFDCEKNNSYYEECIREIEKSSVSANYHVLGERKDINSIMSQVDLLLIPSDRESLSMVALEAINNDLLVITTPCEGPEEILDHNALYICKENSSAGVKEQVERYLYDSVWRERMQTEYPEIKKKVIKRFALDRVAKRYEEVFNDRNNRKK